MLGFLLSPGILPFSPYTCPHIPPPFSEPDGRHDTILTYSTVAFLWDFSQPQRLYSMHSFSFLSPLVTLDNHRSIFIYADSVLFSRLFFMSICSLHCSGSFYHTANHTILPCSSSPFEIFCSSLWPLILETSHFLYEYINGSSNSSFLLTSVTLHVALHRYDLLNKRHFRVKKRGYYMCAIRTFLEKRKYLIHMKAALNSL